ncbi:hypothetical protein K3495_g4852 [Podosphaera aphanis]|nr:hypothetical protein K3495_g4852 [Podosphaera aphanis]
MSLEDPRLKQREFKLIKDEWLPGLNHSGDDGQVLMSSSVVNSIPRGDQLFEEEELQQLWDQGIAKDMAQFQELYHIMWIDKDQFPANLQLRVNRAECELDLRGALCFRKRLWIPNYEPLRTALIHKVHDSHMTWHPGHNCSLAILSRGFYWPGMSTTVRQFCRNCDVCGRSHVWRSKKQGLLLPLPIPDRFHSILSIDFMTDLPARHKSDLCYLMVITDRLLKSVTLEAMNSMNAEECAERFLPCHYRFRGFPQALTSDRGSNWAGDFWSHLCKLVNIEQRRSSAFHPETDGSTERMN